MNDTGKTLPLATRRFVELEEQYGAHNYKPLDVVLAHGSGAWLTDVEGKRYLDCLGAYSAVNQGHAHPRIVSALCEQAQRLTITGRAFRNDQLPLFEQEVCALLGYETALPMNTGVEAVETAIKLARRYGYTVRGIAPDQAEIIVCDNNFHGRTTTIIGFSSEPLYKDGFGPFAPGFVSVPFGDIESLAAVMNERTCAFLVEPIQAEAGILIPPVGYLSKAAALCKERGVLLLADEIQTGLGRTGSLLCCDHEGVKPDVAILGKALSGGVYPVSAVLTSRAVMDVLRPGSHGSTFGGNPLGCAVARAALSVLVDEDLPARAAALGVRLLERLRQIKSPHVKEVRGRGLLVGIELHRRARPFCEALAQRGVLCKETHDFVLRMAPPLVVTETDLEFAVTQCTAVLS